MAWAKAEGDAMRRVISGAGAVALRLGVALGLGVAVPAVAADPPAAGADVEALARAAQNPVAAMVSLPFQNNTNLNYGPRGHTQNVLNIQPVTPLSLSPDWNLINRIVLPVVAQPGLSPGQGSTFGTGPAVVSFFASPVQPVRGLILGAGPVVQAPTASDAALGSNRWGAGPTAVALTMQGPWVMGALVNNIWSFDGGPRNRFNTMTLQPFLNYNFKDGTYLVSSPILTSNWEAPTGNRWLVPAGGGVGRIFKLGGQPMNASLSGYYSMVHPDIGPRWTVRAQVQFMFPK